MAHVLVYYTLLVVIIIYVLCLWNLENVGECCKAQWVRVHQRIALYKSYVLLLFWMISSFDTSQLVNKHGASSTETIKPVLNWATCLFTEHTWDSSNYNSFLNWTFSSLNMVRLMMRCKLRPEFAAEAQQTAWSKMLAKVKSSQYTLIIPVRVIPLSTVSFWVRETMLRLPQVNN